MIGTIKIGWDWDDVVFPWYRLAHKASVAAGIALPDHEPTSWAPFEQYGCTADEWYRVLDDEVLKGAEGMYLHPLEEDIKWQFHRLDQAGFENHVVTARGSFGTLGHHVKELTQMQIDREGVPVKSLHFGHDKPEIINRLGLHYFIDDGPHNFGPIYERCPNTTVYLMNQSWNQDLVVPEGRRLYSVEEFADIVLHEHAVVSV